MLDLDLIDRLVDGYSLGECAALLAAAAPDALHELVRRAAFVHDDDLLVLMARETVRAALHLERIAKN